MSPQTGNWMIAVGLLGGFIGVLMLPAALGEHPDTSLLVLGACGVSLGSMVAAAGVYLKARALQSPAVAGGAAVESKNSKRQVRGGWNVWHGDLPDIHCKVNYVNLFPTAWASTTIFVPAVTFPARAGPPLRPARISPRHAALNRPPIAGKWPK